MTNEEMEKTIHFIIEQQAQFVSDLHQIKDTVNQIKDVQAGFQRQLTTISDATITLISMVGRVAEAQVKIEERFAVMDERFAAMNERFARTDARLLETDERLNAFINVVERYITGKNGKGESRP